MKRSCSMSTSLLRKLLIIPNLSPVRLADQFTRQTIRTSLQRRSITRADPERGQNDPDTPPPLFHFFPFFFANLQNYDCFSICTFNIDLIIYLCKCPYSYSAACILYCFWGHKGIGRSELSNTKYYPIRFAKIMKDEWD